MQGATVRGRHLVRHHQPRALPAGQRVGRPARARSVERRRQLPVGPEDITYWPARDQLWSLSEYPGARYVFAMPRDRFLRGTS